MRISTRSLFAAGLLTVGLIVVPMAGQSVAQTAGDTTTTGTTRTNTPVATNDTRTVEHTDNGSNLGWLGLLGLAGLAGLMPKKTHPVVTTTTHRANDNVNR